MHRPTFFALSLLLLFPAAVFAQAPTDSQTLQALLAEVRLLRQDLRISTLAAQRAQILIYRVQAQEAAVAHASQRLEEATLRRSQIEEKRKQYASQLKWYQDTKDHLESPADQKQYDDTIAQLKAQMDAQLPEEQELQSREVAFREQLSMEEAKLGKLQDELDRLDKALENAIQAASSKSQ